MGKVMQTLLSPSALSGLLGFSEGGAGESNHHVRARCHCSILTSFSSGQPSQKQGWALGRQDVLSENSMQQTGGLEADRWSLLQV